MRRIWLALVIGLLPACGVPTHSVHSAAVGVISTVGEVGHDPGSIAITIDQGARIAPGTQLVVVFNGRALCTVTAEAQANDHVFCSVAQWFVSDHSIFPGSIAALGVSGSDA